MVSDRKRWASRRNGLLGGRPDDWTGEQSRLRLKARRLGRKALLGLAGFCRVLALTAHACHLFPALPASARALRRTCRVVVVTTPEDYATSFFNTTRDTAAAVGLFGAQILIDRLRVPQ